MTLFFLYLLSINSLFPTIPLNPSLFGMFLLLPLLLPSFLYVSFFFFSFSFPFPFPFPFSFPPFFLSLFFLSFSPPFSSLFPLPCPSLCTSLFITSFLSSLPPSPLPSLSLLPLPLFLITSLLL